MSPINSYVPPDIILIDSLVFSNNYELLFQKEKLPASSNHPGHAIVMLAAEAFEGIIEHRTSNNSFHIQSNPTASLNRWIAVIVTINFILHSLTQTNTYGNLFFIYIYIYIYIYRAEDMG